MAFWGGDRIKREFAEAPQIVTPFDVAQIDCSSYRLRLGSQYFVTPDHDVKMRDSIRKDLAAPAEKTGGGAISIPPGQFAFLLTEEELAMPDTVMGFISMRAGFKMHGLINVSGFHVDPGFRGRLVFAVYNAGPATVNLARGEQLFLLWLADLDENSSPEFNRRTKLPQLEIASDMISRVNYPIHSLQNLSKKIDSLESELKIFQRVIYIVSAIVALVFAALNYSKFSGPDQPQLITNSQDSESTAKSLPPGPVKSGAAPAPKDVSERRP